jgi:hypothetical protein
LPRLDFRKRFISLLSFKFREFGSIAALTMLEAANAGDSTGKTRSEFLVPKPITKSLSTNFAPSLFY